MRARGAGFFQEPQEGCGFGAPAATSLDSEDHKVAARRARQLPADSEHGAAGEPPALHEVLADARGLAAPEPSRLSLCVASAPVCRRLVTITPGILRVCAGNFFPLALPQLRGKG